MLFAYQASNCFGSFCGRLAFIGKSVFGRFSVFLSSSGSAIVNTFEFLQCASLNFRYWASLNFLIRDTRGQNSNWANTRAAAPWNFAFCRGAACCALSLCTKKLVHLVLFSVMVHDLGPVFAAAATGQLNVAPPFRAASSFRWRDQSVFALIFCRGRASAWHPWSAV